MPPRTTRTATRGRPRQTRAPRSVFKNAHVGRFDGVYHHVVFKDGDTVRDLLRKANISLNAGDEVNDDRGRAVSSNDKAKETTYHVVGNYKNGQ